MKLIFANFEARIIALILIPFYSGVKGKSMPLCQKGEVYFPDTGKCYLHGEDKGEGPCGSRQVLVPNYLDHRLGECVCESRCLGEKPLAYVKEKHRCYYLYDQGPCEEGQWLIPYGKYSATCEQIPCLKLYTAQRRPPDADLSENATTSAIAQEYDPFRFLFEFAGSCFFTLGNFPGCGPGEEIYFDRHYWRLRCSKDPPEWCGHHAEAQDGPDTCHDGSDRHEDGGCHPTIKFSSHH